MTNDRVSATYLTPAMSHPGLRRAAERFGSR